MRSFSHVVALGLGQVGAEVDSLGSVIDTDLINEKYIRLSKMRDTGQEFFLS